MEEINTEQIIKTDTNIQANDCTVDPPLTKGLDRTTENIIQEHDRMDFEATDADDVNNDDDDDDDCSTTSNLLLTQAIDPPDESETSDKITSNDTGSISTSQNLDTTFESQSSFHIPTFPASNLNSSEESISSEEEEETSEDEKWLSLAERRQQNIERNNKFLKDLQIQQAQQQPEPAPKKKKRTHKQTSQKTRGVKHRAHGMQFSTSSNDIFSLSDSSFLCHMNQKYPHRSTEIQSLHAFFHTFLHPPLRIVHENINQHSNHNTIIPPITFLSGPPSTGKTTILLDLLKFHHEFEKQTSNRYTFGWAYINCAMVGSSSSSTNAGMTEMSLRETLIDILQNAVQQMYQTSTAPNKRSTTDNHSHAKERRTKLAVPKLEKIEKHILEKDLPFEQQEEVQQQQQQQNTDINNPEEQTAATNLLAHRSNYGAIPLAFARSILALTNETNSPCLLVLDRAERLMSLSSSKSDTSSFLSQLLMLPKSMGLNVWIIVLSSRALLPLTRVNNLQTSIQDCLQPINIHFQAYKGKDVFKKIFKTPKMKTATIGYYPPSTLLDIVYDAMLDTLLLSILDSTRDLGEVQRLAQMLWPQYISPLQYEKSKWNHLDLCTEKQNGNGTEDRTLSISEIRELKQDLDRRARSWITKLLSTCLFHPGNTLRRQQRISSSVMTKKPQSFEQIKIRKWTHPIVFNSQNKKSSDISKDREIPPFLKALPTLSQFLLLAGFLCQHNQKESDLALFTKHAKGKRRRNSKISKGMSEQQYRTINSANPFKHSTAIPLERLLSVFCSIFGSYQDDEDEISISRLGSASFFSCLMQLVNLGLFRTYDPTVTSSSNDINMMMRRIEKEKTVPSSKEGHNTDPNGEGDSSSIEKGKEDKSLSQKSRKNHSSKNYFQPFSPQSVRSNAKNLPSNPTARPDSMDMSPRYHCTLSKFHAMWISNEVGFPLSDYLM